MSSGPVALSWEDFDHLIYVRVFEGCNLYCRHCFIPHNPKRLDVADMPRVADAVRTFAPPGMRILVQWHGGEPTVFGPAWMTSAIEALERAAPELVWRHGIQTNLMTYSSDWTDIYVRHFGGMVGVSWDPHIREWRGSNEEYENIFWRNMRRLLADGLTPYLVMTATRPFFERFANPFTLFEFLEERGVRLAHIERLTKTGFARRHWADIGVDNATYSRSMSRLAGAYRLWKRRRSTPGLSPFDGLFHAVGSLRTTSPMGHGCWSGRCDTRFHTFDANGYRAGCTALTAEDPVPGVIHIDVDAWARQRERRQAPCATCRYRPVCSSGCMASPYLDASGECAGGRRLFEAIDKIVTSG